MTKSQLPSRLIFSGTIVLLALLLAGCFGRNDTPTGPNVLNLLPAGWTPVEFGNSGLFSRSTVWTPVNIDGDPSTEYLLYFTYDSNQVGAVIYKEALASAGAGPLSPTPIPAPNQPAGGYIPYRLEPSYWLGSGVVGYVAPPGTPSSQITTMQLQRDPAPGLGSRAPVTATVKELAIQGGTTVLTVAWWQNQYNGYGVTQVQAFGGLVGTQHQDNDKTKPIITVTGLERLPAPLGRSILCRQTLYVRGSAPELPTTLPDPYATAIQYVPDDEGIVFCETPLPPYPFYPEGVALAFIRPQNRDDPNETLAALNSYRLNFVEGQNEALMNQWLALFDFDGPDNNSMPTVVVDQLVTPPFLALSSDYRSPSGVPLTTAVCAVVIAPDGNTTRTLQFNMLYQPPTFLAEPAPGAARNQPAQTTTTDRMVISNVVDMTATNLTCQQIVNDYMAANGQAGVQP